MRPLSLTFGASVLPSFSLVAAAGTKDCHGKICHPIEEYCSNFAEDCHSCASICDKQSHNYNVDTCVKECAEFNKFESLNEEIRDIHSRQRIITILLIIILLLIAIRYAWKGVRWLRHKRCIAQMLKKLQPKTANNAGPTATGTTPNGKDLNATTIQNLNAINGDIERAPSQIYSVAGAVDCSVLTMTTPVSTRYPAENSTTPTTIAEEYSYDNQALAVTPVSEKPGGHKATF